jgi:hypothetical protein
MSRHRPSFGSEPRTAAGESLLSHNHLVLMQTLLDRPRGRVASCNEWLNAAWPLARSVFSVKTAWSLRRGVRTLHPAWVRRTTEGNRITATLTPRGRAILARELPARVRGYGPYRGLATLRTGVRGSGASGTPGSAT